MAKNQELLDVIDLVADAMDESLAYNLTAEVIASSMVALRDNPGMSIEEALNHGLSDWDI
jgi:hypothetical protein